MTSNTRNISHPTPRLENLFDPATRPVRAGASSPPGPCRQAPVRARVIEHGFEVREVTTPLDTSQIRAYLEMDEGLDELRAAIRDGLERELWARYKRAAVYSKPLAVSGPDFGVRIAPESRRETAGRSDPGYKVPNPALRAVAHSSNGGA